MSSDKVIFFLFLVFLSTGVSGSTIFQDDFSKNSLDSWNVERNEKETSFPDDFVRFSGRGINGDDVILTSVDEVNSADGLNFEGRMRFESISDSYRDHEMSVVFYLQNSSGSNLGYVKFYTRWEGTNSNYVSGRCTESGAGSWCVYGGQKIYSPTNDAVNIHVPADYSWANFSTSWKNVSNELSSVNEENVQKVKTEIREYSAWSAGNTVSFDYVSLSSEEGGLFICDRRGLFNECISNSTHEVSGESFDISSVFQAEASSVFEALSSKATLNVSNSTSISGTWKGSFDILSGAGDTRLKSGAIFRPENGRILIN